MRCKLELMDSLLFERMWKHVVLVFLAISQQQFSSAPPLGLAPARFGRHAARGEFPSEEGKQTREAKASPRLEDGGTERDGRADRWRCLPISSQHPNLDLDGPCSFTGPYHYPVTMETAADIPESPTNLSHKIQKLSWNIKPVNQLFIFQQ